MCLDPRVVRAGLALALTLAAFAPEGGAITALDRGAGIEVDGFTSDFEGDEIVFGVNEELGTLEESLNDSEWGPFNDVNQIKITWDADSLYLAVDGFIFDNNTILFVDVTDEVPGDGTPGLAGMTEVNAWRRNFVFSDDFAPDFFVATWDRNGAPQMWTVTGTNQVVQVASTQFRGVATFDGSSTDRAMEFAIPWSSVFFGQSQRDFVPELDDGSGVEPFAWQIPDGMGTLKLAAVITAGADGTGGPDSAPDNFNGHSNDSAALVTIDNYAIIPLDDDDFDDGVAGYPDFGANVKGRVSFKRRPPIEGIKFDVARIEITNPIVSPEESRDLEFEVRLDPATAEEFREVSLTARIYDMRGQVVRSLYVEDVRPAASPNDPAMDRWDGRDGIGRPVPGGIYILSVVEEVGPSRAKRAFSVVR